MSCNESSTSHAIQAHNKFKNSLTTVLMGLKKTIEEEQSENKNKGLEVATTSETRY